VKPLYFKGEKNCGLDPAFGLMSVADGTLSSIGHLFVASIVNNGPGPGFLTPWLYEFLVGGIEAIGLPSTLDHTIYDKVCLSIDLQCSK